MREKIKISINDIKLDKDEVLRTQGIPSNKEPRKDLAILLKKAIKNFFETAHPIGIISEISIPEFEIVYCGEGLNEDETPLDKIFKKADSLALFAVTVGEKVSKQIDELFKSNEFAMATMLDSTASNGTEKAADVLEEKIFNTLLNKDKTDLSTSILRYSPGYCGWHVSGQKKLFEFLRPEVIGITLLDSFMMKPLKSISGVMVAGKKEIHKFKDSYPFCKQCKNHSCRDRIRKLLKVPRSKKVRGVG